MKVVELIKKKHSFFTLPKERPKEKYFPVFIEEMLDTYKKILPDVKNNNPNYPSTESLRILADSIVQCIKEAYQGNIISAYEKLSTGINEIKDYLKIYQSDINCKYLTLYRARKEKKPLTKEEMFHIQFDKRHLLNDQRYSVQGLPCLYLCNSSYLCWEELRQPNLNEFQVSRLDLDMNYIRIIDISLTADAVLSTHQVTEDMDVQDMVSSPLGYHLIATWPIALATSICVIDFDAAFKPEYIVPQLLLQWIKNNTEFYGVKYFSTKTLSINHNSTFLFSNYVIPVVDVLEKGYCNFSKKHIMITDPLTQSLSEINSYSYNAEDAMVLLRKDINWKQPEHCLSTFKVNDGSELPYLQSMFGRLEIQLAKQKAEFL